MAVNIYMDHFYQNIDGFMNHRNTIMLDQVIADFPAGGTWVELGSWTGRSAAYCAVELINRNKLGKFYCVDTWKGEVGLNYDQTILASVRDIFLGNVEPIKQHLTMLEMLSWEAATQFADNSVDFCYVDAGHSYECVMQDLEAWWPKIRPGAWFAGDDYTKGYPGLQQAVWEFFGDRGLKVRRSGRCWTIRKV